MSAQVTQKLLILHLLGKIFCSLNEVDLDTFSSASKVENDDVIAVLDVNLL